jgi:hypothetical protein
MADIAFDTIDKIDRNLFERNCDVQAWATFDKVLEAVEEDDDAVRRQASALLKNLVDIYEVYYDVFIMDLGGVVLASGTYPKIVGQDMSGESWFQETVRTGCPTVIDMHYSEVIGGYTVGYNCPICDKGGTVKGVLSTRFNWSFIYDIIDSAKVSGSGQLLLINRDGFVIGSKNRDDVFKKSVSGMDEAKRAMQGETYGYSTRSNDGSIDIIGFAHTRGYNAYKGKDWSVIAVETLEL